MADEFIIYLDFALFLAVYNTLLPNFDFVYQTQKHFPVKRINVAILAYEVNPFLYIVLYGLIFLHALF